MVITINHSKQETQRAIKEVEDKFGKQKVENMRNYQLKVNPLNETKDCYL